MKTAKTTAKDKIWTPEKDKFEVKLITNSSETEFEQSVNRALEKGWDTYGELKVTSLGSYCEYTQLMSRTVKAGE